MSEEKKMREVGEEASLQASTMVVGFGFFLHNNKGKTGLYVEGCEAGGEQEEEGRALRSRGIVVVSPAPFSRLMAKDGGEPLPSSSLSQSFRFSLVRVCGIVW